MKKIDLNPLYHSSGKKYPTGHNIIFNYLTYPNIIFQLKLGERPPYGLTLKFLVHLPIIDGCKTNVPCADAFLGGIKGSN